MKTNKILLSGGISALFAFALILGGCNNDDAKKGMEQPAAPAVEAPKPAESTAPATPAPEAAPALKEGETPEVKEEMMAPAAPAESAETGSTDAAAPAEGEPKPQ